jgi:autotransporter-associated beta strand protein
MLAAGLSVAWPALGWAQQPAFIQSFQSQGPAPTFGPGGDVQSRDAAPFGTTSGAIQAVLPDPTNSGTMFIGAANGGVWGTRNGGQTWTPLTDKQASLSIASLGSDPTNTQRIFAGVGITSNGAVGRVSDDNVTTRGGARTGILYSPDGGASWQAMGTTALSGKSVVGVAASGQTILAATAEPHNADAEAGYGLYRSVKGGTDFQLVTAQQGLASGAATSLVGQGTAGNPYFVAIHSSQHPENNGVYRSVNGGADWTRVLQTNDGQVGRLAAGPNGSVAVGLYDATAKRINGLQLSTNRGDNWAQLAAPPINPGSQAAINFAIAVDKKNSNIVYVAGDRQSDTVVTVSAYRVALLPNGTSGIPQLLTDAGTGNNSTVHADARAFAFDADGRLILVGDGGIYLRSDPQSNAGIWTGLNTSTLSVREPYAVAYDAISKRLVVAAQDNGTSLQSAPGGRQFSPLDGGDGTNAAINDRTQAAAGLSRVYTTAQNFGGLTRTILDAEGRVVGSINRFDRGPDLTADATRAVPILNFVNVNTTNMTDFTEADGADFKLPFASRIILNRRDPNRIAIGTNYAYVTTDALLFDPKQPAPLTNVGTNTRIGPVTALAYGTGVDTDAFVDALLVGTSGNQGSRLYFSASSGAGTLQVLDKYQGGIPTAVLFDARTQERFFVTDGADLWHTNTTGQTPFASLTTNLTTLGIGRPTSLEFIANNGVNALLVGGLVSDPNALSPIAVANSDANGNLSGWSSFGRGLPNTIVSQLTYNPSVDVLAVGLYGRGAWVMYDVTSFFSTATTLRFGLADNDSAPDASFLTNGVYASRNLEKVGAGTLTIDGTTSYKGTTRVLGGQLTANGDLRSSSSLFVGPAGMLRGTGMLPSTTVSGVLAPGNSIGTLTVNGNLVFNPGSVYQIVASGAAAARTNVTGTATLAGTTLVSYSGTNFMPRATILSAAGGLNGRFDAFSLSGSLPSFFNAYLGYGATDVVLNLQSALANTPGLGGNQRSVARALDNAFNAGPGLSAMPALFSLTAGQIPSTLSILAGDNASVGQSVTIAAGSQFAALMTNRASTRRAEQLAFAPCDKPAAAACEAPPPDWSAWTTAFGGARWLNADPVTGAAAALQNIGGGAFGGDYRLGPNTLAGVAVGLSDSNYSVAATGANGRATGAHFGLYGLHDWQGFYLNAAAAYNRFDGNATRSIAGIGTTETAKSSAISHELAGRVEVGRPFEVGQFDGGRFGITPFAALQPSQLWTPGITESSVTASGAPGVFALNYQPQGTTSLPSFLGAQLDGQTELDGKPLKGWVRAAWVHEFLTSRSVTAGFTVLPGSNFTVDGARAASNAARFDFGVNYAVGSQTSLFANGNVELSDRGQSIAGTAGFKFTW